MATGGWCGAGITYRGNNSYPKTMYTSRSRSMLPSSTPRSNSAISSRTYSRVKENSVEIQRNMNFEEEEPSQFDIEELQNEQELLERMIDQQKQLQELRERQQRVLELQQQLSSMEESAEYSKEDKLKTAKIRLDELQKLVSTIKSVKADDKEGSGDSPVNTIPDKAQQVKRALEELNELKTLIGLVSEANDVPSPSQRKPVVTMEPVFANSVEADEQVAANFQSVLPEVSVVQYDDNVREASPRPTCRNSSQSRKRASKDPGRRAAHSALNLSRGGSSRGSSAKKREKTARIVSPKKEEQDSQASERLFQEMKRHQALLKELRERKQELEELMNMTRETRDDEVKEREDEYIDANASIRSNAGSPNESREVSVNEAADDFDTSQSGRLFGLNETDTRRLIDLMRNQKNLGATTEKTTATWGSSSTNSTDSGDDDDKSRSARNDRSSIQPFTDKRLVKVADWSLDNDDKSPSARNDLSSIQPFTDKRFFKAADWSLDNDDKSPSARNDRSMIQPFNDKRLSKVSDWSQDNDDKSPSVRNDHTSIQPFTDKRLFKVADWSLDNDDNSPSARNDRSMIQPFNDKRLSKVSDWSQYNDDKSPSARNDSFMIQPFTDKRLSKVSDWSRDSTIGTSVRDAFTQLNSKEEHEIDFRPPTRRRRNVSRPENRVVSLDSGSSKSTVSKLQEELIASNTTMHILLEDQLSLTKLLLNTLNLQQPTVSSNLCYGISPDFLIYQLDNCSAQFAATLKETKDMQWQVYGLTKGCKSVEKPATASRMPLAPLNYVPAQQYQAAEADAGFQLSDYDDEDAAEEKCEANRDSGNELFEAMRDCIYSEAAILISQNESRPHFLKELFHTLQQLNTDYLRQNALYTLQDIMKGYLPSTPRRRGKDRENKSSPRNNTKARNVKVGSFSENTPSESPPTSEDEDYAKLKAKAPETGGYDFSLKVSSASELSTPSDEDIENNPFAASDLGSTVIHLDAEINTKILRVWIKNIISEIIPVLKKNHDKAVDKKLVKLLRSKVLECISKGIGNQDQMRRIADDDTDKLSIVDSDFFPGQLKSIVDDSFAKFIGKTVGSCGEDMIVGLSEILFNELAFFHMIQDLGNEKPDAEKKTNIPVIRIDQDEVVPLEKRDGTESNSKVDDVIEDPEEDSEVSNTEDNVPGSNAENDVEGRKDSRQVSPNPVTVDLSVSETKPMTSYGSGEDEEEEGSGDEYEYVEPDVPTSMQQDTNEVKGKDENQDGQKEEVKVEEPTSQDAADKIEQSQA